MPFPFHYFSRSFSRWFNFTHFFGAITIRWCSTATARTSREFNGLFGTRGVRSICFIGRRPDPSWQQLWWGVIRFQNFRSLKLGLLCLHGFPCFKRINRVYRFDGFLWNLAKMFLGYQCEKGVRLFLISQMILVLLRALVTKIGNLKIDFLSKKSEYRKSLTPFYSLSPTDWQFVFSYLRAGRQVIQFSRQCQFCVLRLARIYH